MDQSNDENALGQLNHSRADTINLRQLVDVILSKNLSLNFQKTYSVPKINIKKRDEKLLHQTKEMIKQEGIRVFLNRMYRNKLYLSKHSAVDLAKYLKNHYQIKPNARRIVSL